MYCTYKGEIKKTEESREFMFTLWGWGIKRGRGESCDRVSEEPKGKGTMVRIPEEHEHCSALPSPSHMPSYHQPAELSSPAY